MSETQTQPLLGAVKKIRANVDLVYLGRSVRGKRKIRIDGSHGSYEIIHTPGEEFECDQAFAKEAIMSGKAELVSGGNVDVTPRRMDFPFTKIGSATRAIPSPFSNAAKCCSRCLLVTVVICPWVLNFAWTQLSFGSVPGFVTRTNLRRINMRFVCSSSVRKRCG
jgi:hypothetical protein